MILIYCGAMFFMSAPIKNANLICFLETSQILQSIFKYVIL